MGSTAFMFPGQGSQYIGMAASFYEEFKCSRNVFEQASQSTEIDLRQICFSENKLINQTEYTQIAMYTAEVAMLRALEESNITSNVNLGLSLGEYTALTASGGISFSSGCQVVRQRGILMEHEVPSGKGGMAAVLGMNAQAVEQVVNRSGYELVSIANYNCPGQIVISGEVNQLQEVSEMLKQEGARRVIKLNVSGPFHSPMLIGAGQKLSKVLEQVELSELSVPYVTNVSAEYVRSANEQIKDLLIRQVYSPVRFEQSIRRLLADGVTTFVEIGPGKTLSGFVKKIALAVTDEKNEFRIPDLKVDDIRIYSLEKTDDLTKIADELRK